MFIRQKYNSSKYRVVPLVNTIRCNPQKFALFLSAVHTPNQKRFPALSCPMEENAYFYGDHEKHLKPSKKHLMRLIEYIAHKDFGKISVSNKKREDLYGLHTEADRIAAKNEALQQIENIYDKPLLPKAWYIFEGSTNPDIYIEGKDYVILCEGKWTESHITTKTEHLKAKNENRNQMIRHIQGALHATNKKIYAFYIVDIHCNYMDCLNESAFETQLNDETIKIDSEEKANILNAFYGYTTWQELEKIIEGLRFLEKDQIDQINGGNTYA